MVVFPNAKINLGLNIVSKRVDGYHNLETVFYPVPWCDILEIVDADEFQFTHSGLAISGPPDHNLVVKAYQLLKTAHNLPPVKIHLHKVIPMGAGLGGGSSDAAFTFKLLNEKYHLGLTTHDMVVLAAKLGSDCSFFINNKPVFAFNRGNDFEDINLSLQGYYITILFPNLHIPTKEAFNGLILYPTEKNIKTEILKDISSWKDILSNDFETTIFKKHPQLNEIKQSFYHSGALYASMTGSGSALYGIYRSKPTNMNTLLPGYLQWEGYL